MPAFLVQIITKLLSMTDGYKTILSGIGMIGFGFYLLFVQKPPDVNSAIKTIFEGLAILGFGHKMAKNNAAQNVVDGPITPASLAKQPFQDGTEIR